MKNDIDFIDWADAYLKDELSEEEKVSFEKYCDENPHAASSYKYHHLIFQKLREYQARKELKENMLKIMEKPLPSEQVEKNAIPISTAIRRIWNTYKHTAVVAASVALVAVFATLWMSGFYNNVKESSYQYSLLKRDMNNIKRNVNAQNAVINTINTDLKASETTYPVGTYGGTGFAITSDGFIATNYHVIKDADSIHVQNAHGDAYKAVVTYIDPVYDLAILEITDSKFNKNLAIPYTFKDEQADIGQEVFTIGYPREDAVYGSGYLSSSTGFDGDTASYQVTIPVNPGNSGGPLLDNKGNIVGIISGKQTETDGAAFAIKTQYLLKSIHAIPADSLKHPITLNARNGLIGQSRTNQIKKIQDFIYVVKVF